MPRPVCSRNHLKGFTLIEVMVALTLFSMLTILGYQAFSGVLAYNERNRTSYEAHNQLYKASFLLTQDLMHLRARPIRNRLGGRERAYTTADPDYAVKFTRGGVPSLAGSATGGLQRVAYSVSAAGELIRWTWPTLDAFTREEPFPRVVMESVSSLRVYQLNGRNEFEENWPPLNQRVSIDELPRMIRVELELNNGDRIERLIPGLQALPRQSGSNRHHSGDHRASPQQ